jgi:hypothetical protein
VIGQDSRLWVNDVGRASSDDHDMYCVWVPKYLIARCKASPGQDGSSVIVDGCRVAALQPHVPEGNATVAATIAG